jgi:hypothetical protein
VAWSARMLDDRLPITSNALVFIAADLAGEALA